MTYKLTDDGVIHPDGYFIPDVAGNSDWGIYLAWLALGNVPDPADPPPPPTENEVARAGVRAWYEAHPSAALLVNLSIEDLDAEIDTLCDALFPPPIPVASKNKMKLWMKTISHGIRALSKREGFT